MKISTTRYALAFGASLSCVFYPLAAVGQDKLGIPGLEMSVAYTAERVENTVGGLRRGDE